jgi:hypothetical protein
MFHVRHAVDAMVLQSTCLSVNRETSSVIGALRSCVYRNPTIGYCAFDRTTSVGRSSSVIPIDAVDAMMRAMTFCAVLQHVKSLDVKSKLTMRIPVPVG